MEETRGKVKPVRMHGAVRHCIVMQQWHNSILNYSWFQTHCHGAAQESVLQESPEQEVPGRQPHPASLQSQARISAKCKFLCFLNPN